MRGGIREVGPAGPEGANVSTRGEHMPRRRSALVEGRSMVDPGLLVFRLVMDDRRWISGREGSPTTPTLGALRRSRVGNRSGFRPLAGSLKSGSGVSARWMCLRWVEAAL